VLGFTKCPTPGHDPGGDRGLLGRRAELILLTGGMSVTRVPTSPHGDRTQGRGSSPRASPCQPGNLLTLALLAGPAEHASRGLHALPHHVLDVFLPRVLAGRRSTPKKSPLWRGGLCWLQGLPLFPLWLARTRLSGHGRQGLVRGVPFGKAARMDQRATMLTAISSGVSARWPSDGRLDTVQAAWVTPGQAGGRKGLDLILASVHPHIARLGAGRPIPAPGVLLVHRFTMSM
jgi:hypothetical protein